MAWEIVVGIETHAQLLTRSKMFSGASTAFGAAPNTQASAVDLALPGTLPVANRAAIEHAIRFGLAVNGRISPRSIFARKNYFYPDLPKGYQISQYEIPVVQGGSVRFFLDKEEKSIRLTRAHLEEDAGKSLHENFSGMTGIDLNRAGTPLLEIVTEPELRGAKEAVAYARTLHALVRWIGICDGNMQEGSFRCDANVSVRRAGDTKLGTRCEIKNLNSFRFMEQAIEFEARRQVELIEDGKKVVQETRLYDPDKNETRPMRSKEDAQDYRYFPDPDLLPLVISESDIDRIRAEMPEKPLKRRYRFMASDTVSYQNLLRAHEEIDDEAELDVKLEKTLRTEYKRIFHGLSPSDASSLTATKEMSDYFEETVAALPAGNSKLAANWVLGEVAAALNRDNLDTAQIPVKPEQLARLLSIILDGKVNAKQAKEVVFRDMWEAGKKISANVAVAFENMTARGEAGTLSVSIDPDKIIEAKGLGQISDASAIEKIVDEVLAANAKQVADYRSGKEKAFNSLVGQVMKSSKGKANPAQVNGILRRKLDG